MKKRIGTRDYDTDASRVIAKNGEVTLYQKRTRMKEFFISNGTEIIHLEDEEAERFLKAEGTEIIEHPESIRTYSRNGFYSVWIKDDIYNILSAESRRKKTSISDVIREVLRKVGLM